VSDRGRIYRAVVLRRTMRRLRIQQRFGAVGQTGSIALLERFWRTLKQARARPGAAVQLPFTVAYLDGDPRCPILLQRAA